MNRMTWNNEFDLQDCCYSVSYAQDYIECIIKKHEILIAIPPIQFCVNRINNISVLKIKDG